MKTGDSGRNNSGLITDVIIVKIPDLYLFWCHK